LQHVPSRGWFGSAEESPADSSAREFIKKGRFHQQRFIADETCPVAGITLRITTEVITAEHLDQITSLREVAAMAAKQLQACVPVVVPFPFTL